jgi:uncharacterized phiE125 gp8 family phage protein
MSIHSTCVLIEPPTADVVSRDEVKQHLRVDFDDDDNTIDRIIAAAVGLIDPAAGGWLGRALRPQTWELRRAEFTACIELPYPPLISMDSVTYDDANGFAQTLVKDVTFKAVTGRLDKVTLIPAYGLRWPAARIYPESVRIRFTSGYPAGAGDRLPAPIKQWLLLVIGSLWESRESFISAPSAQIAELPPHVLSMIDLYRIY